MQNSINIKQNLKKIHRNNKEIKNENTNRNYKYILIDLSGSNVQSIANVILGYGIYWMFSSIDLGFESVIVINAFKYLSKL